MNINIEPYAEQALKWRDEHLHHVDLMVVMAETSYPPDGLDRPNPALWKAAHWRWFYEFKQLSRPKPLLAVHTVEEYAKLPISMREQRHWLWHRMYLRPYALSWDMDTRLSEWDKFDTFVEDHYPIQAFFRETVKDWIGFKKFCLRERYWSVRNVFFPRQRWLTKQIRRDWQDKRSLAVDLLYMLVVHFIEGEKALETINWDDEPGHIEFKKGLLASYDWIKKGRPALIEEMDQELSRATKAKGEYGVRYGKYNEIEKRIEDTDTAMCKWIVENRCFLWS